MYRWGYRFVPVGQAGPAGTARYGIMGRVEGWTQDGVCTVAGEAHPLLPQRRPGRAEPPAEPGSAAGTRHVPGADPPGRLPDLTVLRQVLAGLRRLD